MTITMTKNDEADAVLARAIAHEGQRAARDAEKSRKDFLAKVSQEVRTISSSEIDILDLVARVAEEFRQRAAAKGVRMLVLLPEYATSLSADAQAIKRTLRCLLDNAVKFTGSGVIKVKVATDMASSRPLRITVSDTGIGISMRELDDVSATLAGTKANTPGAVRGLAVAAGLCAGMGYTLSVKSEDGKGSSFSISLQPTS
jgi:signal transduction histidine kinase